LFILSIYLENVSVLRQDRYDYKNNMLSHSIARDWSYDENPGKAFNRLQIFFCNNTQISSHILACGLKNEEVIDRCTRFDL